MNTTKTINMNQLRKDILAIAKRGWINLEAIRDITDLEHARKFSPSFKLATEGCTDPQIFAAVIEEQLLGERKFRSERGLWLTDAEAAPRPRAPRKSKTTSTPLKPPVNVSQAFQEALTQGPVNRVAPATLSNLGEYHEKPEIPACPEKQSCKSRSISLPQENLW